MANDGEITYVLLLKQLIHPTIAIFLVVLQLTRVRSVGTIRALGLPYGIGLGASDSVTERTQLPYSPEVIFGGTRDRSRKCPKARKRRLFTVIGSTRSHASSFSHGQFPTLVTPGSLR